MIKNKYYSLIGLVKWSLIRHKFYIPIFIIVQIILSIAIIYGFSFIINATDNTSKSFIFTGAITINIIAVTCVLSPQIVSDTKQNGVLEYLKTLPIKRVGIIMSDLFIWGLISLPGIFTSIVLGTIKFNMKIKIDFISLLSLILIVTSLILLGFAIAYLFPPNIVVLITQIVMIGGLLFSPIVYPADRIPLWMSSIYNYLPFVPVSNIIRYKLFSLGRFNIIDYIVILFWGLASLGVSIYVLNRRK